MSARLQELRERFPRVAVVHDWLTIPGGSEQVVMELLAMFPQAELFTSVYDPEPWPAEITDRPVHASFLNRIPGATGHYRRLLPLMSAAYRAFDLARFDLVLSSSHASAKNVRTPPGTLHVCYCHTPMRYAWEKEFLAEEEVGPLVRLGLPTLMWHLRRVDRRGATGPDLLVANSRHVAARIERYWGRESVVVNPPVDVEPMLDVVCDRQDFYLSFGRIVPYKRVDLALDACRRLGRRLEIAGTGRALDSVRSRLDGAEQVRFLGRVSDEERRRLFCQARALLFPGEEDFGIIPVEAQAAGLPVIAYRVGGASETVIDGETGVLFDEQTPEALASAIELFETMSLDPAAARANALRFGRERFRAEMAEVIAGAVPRLAQRGG